jgi:hypothetical protein
MDEPHRHGALATAEATRLIELLRTSPAANTPGRPVSCMYGSREVSCQASTLSPTPCRLTGNASVAPAAAASRGRPWPPNAWPLYRSRPGTSTPAGRRNAHPLTGCPRASPRACCCTCRLPPPYPHSQRRPRRRSGGRGRHAHSMVCLPPAWPCWCSGKAGCSKWSTATNSSWVVKSWSFQTSSIIRRTTASFSWEALRSPSLYSDNSTVLHSACLSPASTGTPGFLQTTS